MKDRILQIMKSEGMTQQEFSRATGIAPASLSSIFNGRTAPTMKHAEAMHRYFPRLSMAWLLFGEGEMFTLTDEEIASRTRVDGESAENDPTGMHAQTGGADMPSASDQTGKRPADMAAYQQATSSHTAQQSYVRAREAVEGASGAPEMHSGMLNGYPPFYPGMPEMVKYPDIKQRKIVEIRIFFDDGTFETFQGN